MAMRDEVLLVVLVLAAACAGSGEPPAGVETGADNPAIDTIFAPWNKPGSPGCALAVARDGEFVYTRGYGYANLDYDIPVTPQTVFDVASVTKQFVAAVANLLAQDGTVSLDDGVRVWLPELPEYASPVTLRHLIHHTGGLRDYLNLFPLAGSHDYYAVSREQLLAMMSRQRAPVFSPGERYEYSNTGYMLLAHALERAAGKSLGELAHERIFEPLGMDGSLMYENREVIIPRRATGYHRDDDGRLRVVHNYDFEIAGDGQLYTTVEDLLRWDEYLHGADKPAIHQSMLTEGTLSNGEPIEYAHGITLGEYRGLRTVGHGGHSWGFLTELRRYVEPGLSIAVSCNAEYGDPGELARRVADHYLADQLGPEEGDDEEDDADDEDEDSPAAPSLSSAELAAFAGSFFSAELDATYRFAAGDEGLTLRVEQQPALEVQPVAEDEFRVEFESRGWAASPARLEFQRDDAGAVTGFSLSSGSERGLVFEKLPALEVR
ncbi:MAG: serine hydrolase [Holophagales bacterium]|nr:serine hydrolase [Holophagales bacterium]MYH27181.1 serine hydrolase [Holophagales bacterium]